MPHTFECDTSKLTQDLSFTGSNHCWKNKKPINYGKKKKLNNRRCFFEEGKIKKSILPNYVCSDFEKAVKGVIKSWKVELKSDTKLYVELGHGDKFSIMYKTVGEVVYKLVGNFNGMYKHVLENEFNFPQKYSRGIFFSSETEKIAFKVNIGIEELIQEQSL